MSSTRRKRRTEEESSMEDVSSVEILSSKTEMGFLLLTDCSIYVKSTGEATLPHRKWMDVDFIDSVWKQQQSEAGEGQEEETIRDRENDSAKPPCPHCHLVFHHEEKEEKLAIFKDQLARFQGTVADQNHHQQANNSRCRAKKRSDGALLLGALLDAQDHGYVSMQTLRILVHDTTTNISQGEGYSSARASLVATISFPALAGASSPGKTTKRRRPIQPTLRSIVPQARRTSRNTKPLPPSVQLILSIIQSDWSLLDGQMGQLERTGAAAGKHHPTRENPALFPPKLSLEELYIRIQGSACKNRLEQEEDFHQQSASESNELSLLTLPLEILKTQIAPYLRAKSLDSLRCTCKSFHQSLASVIPGLKLKLFSHQIRSLQWMREREVRPISEANKGSFDPKNEIRAMTGGQSTWLCPRGGKGLRVDQMTGCEMPMDDDDLLARQGARGGLLCDDPGLGKTITILALILQTMGLSTEEVAAQAKKSGTTIQTDEMFDAYWKEDIAVEYRRQELCRLMSKIKRLDPSINLFLRPIDPTRDGCEDYLDVIQQPMCINDICKKISNTGYADFGEFVRDVELCFRNAMEYNPTDHEVHQAARNLLQRFQKELLEQFKQQQLRGLRGSATNADLKPNSSVAALMKKKSEQDFRTSLVPSSSTLVVIPHVLMDHWLEQIKTHVNFRYATDLEPLVYVYSPARKSAVGMEEALRLCQVDKTHQALIFVDKAGPTHKLPSPQFLAMFSIVITTTNRFSSEWKNGSFQEEIKKKENSDQYVNYRLMEYDSLDEEACPLLKVRWLRMIIDEGHSLGRGKSGSSILFASWISSQRRWAMTGTPTVQTVSANGLSNLQGLFNYLQHDFFTGRKNGDKVWKRSVAKSWKDGDLASFFRLKMLLQLLMVRHTKLDIEELPPPIFRTNFVKMSTIETTTYNTLVSAVQGNLKLTSMNGRISGQQDSLLDRSQAKHAKLALTNIRRICCGRARVVPVVKHEAWIEFMQLCMLQHRMPQDKVQEMENYLQQTTSEELARCHCCGMLLSMLLVHPCGCLLCTECTDNQANACVMCDKPFDVDDFQRLQPGLEYNWVVTDEHFDAKGNPVAPNATAQGAVAPGVVAPDAVGAMVQNADAGQQLAPNAVAAQGGAAAGGRQLLRPPEQRRRTRKPGDGHECEYNATDPGKCTLCFQLHDHCKLVNQGSCCDVCYRKPLDCPKSESKACYLIDKILGLYEDQQSRERDFTPTADFGRQTPRGRPVKIIVFSQFKYNLNEVGSRLLKRLGSACVAEYWGKYRTAELNKFVHDPDCFVMLLGKDGSEGLDLSFVTHIFLCEAIWDKSLEQQTVARAWRMGAKGRVQVETLLSKHSVEERLHKLEPEEIIADAGSNQTEGQGGNASSLQRSKVAFLLKSLKLMADVELAPLPAPEQVQKRFGFEKEALNPPAGSNQAEEPPAKKRRVAQRRVRFALVDQDVVGGTGD